METCEHQTCEHQMPLVEVGQSAACLRCGRTYQVAVDAFGFKCWKPTA